MANHYSALKRMRQTQKREEINRGRRTRLRHAIRELRRAITGGERDKARVLASQTVSLIDRSRKVGLIKENTASRYKSRLMAHLAAMPAR